jgi:prepilin-type N-terminal cleavage/methylation domain-containing protein
MKRRSNAFTLIEILLVTSLIGIVSIAVFRSFNNGIKLWAKAQRINREAEAAIFLDKMAEDLRSAVTISSIAFKGTGHSFSFPAVVLTPADVKSYRAVEEVIDQIGAVQYRYDPEAHKIFRRQVNYSQAVKGIWPSLEIAMVSGIEELDFDYVVPTAEGYVTKSEINSIFPSGVYVKVHYKDDTGIHELKRFLPMVVGE